VSDRDAIFKARARILEGGRRVRANFDAIPWPALPPPPGVVRFARLHGSYEMTALAASLTRVVYQIDAHPGGMVPDWFVRYSSKYVPIATLSNLRKESRRIGTRYKDFIARHRPPATVKATPSANPPAP
jgi:hypothetical protein